MNDSGLDRYLPLKALAGLFRLSVRTLRSYLMHPSTDPRGRDRIGERGRRSTRVRVWIPGAHGVACRRHSAKLALTGGVAFQFAR